MERKAMSKKLRFEVFKRDSFTCQYCGRSAPNIVLQVDHIKPVKDGGNNGIFNLITSCFDCNSGKSDRKLDDSNYINKQKEELDKINDKRLQLDLLIKWQEELLEQSNKEAEYIAGRFSELTGYSPTEAGIKAIKMWIKKHSMQEILESMSDAVEYYYNNDAITAQKAFDSILKFIKNKKLYKEKPYLKDLYYIRGIARNRYRYIDENIAMVLLTKSYEVVKNTETLKDITLSCRNWTEFRDAMNELIEGKNV